jgi:hypothetical protein
MIMSGLQPERTYHIVELKELPPVWLLDEMKELYGPTNSDRWLVRGRSILFVSPIDHMTFVIKYS